MFFKVSELILSESNSLKSIIRPQYLLFLFSGLFLIFLGSNEPIGDKWFGLNGKKGDELRPLFMVVNYLSYSHSIVEGGFDEMS